MHSLSLVVARSGYSLVAVHRLLIVVDSLVADHGLLGVCVSGEGAAVLVASPSVRTWSFPRVGG